MYFSSHPLPLMDEASPHSPFWPPDHSTFVSMYMRMQCSDGSVSGHMSRFEHRQPLASWDIRRARSALGCQLSHRITDECSGKKLLHDTEVYLGEVRRGHSEEYLIVLRTCCSHLLRLTAQGFSLQCLLHSPVSEPPICFLCFCT